jgi:RNA polymerase sigma-54 factor
MAIEIKQSLRLSQSLVITPQLQQAIKLLQLSRMELQDMVQKELVDNPVLEETPESEPESENPESSVSSPPNEHETHDPAVPEVGQKDGELNKEPKDFDWENYIGTYNSNEISPGNGSRAPSNEDAPIFENTVTRTETLQEHLLWQLHLNNLTESEVLLAEDIIGSTNGDGYFSGKLEEIAANNGHPLKIVEEVLHTLQTFDPAGVFARDLKECLKLQTQSFNEDRSLICRIIDEHLNDLEKRHYTVIAKKIGISVEKVQEMAKLISMLEPKPGRPFGGENPQYITPDVYVQKMGSDYVITLNDDGLPKLQVSNFYRNALSNTGTSGQAKEYIQEKLRSASWLIRSIHQRQRTLYKVTASIVKFQKEFLDQGVNFLRPMVLKDVADDISMHESTISRVTTNKYVHTPQGIFELKFFFNARVRSSSPEGVTSEAVKNYIKKMIAIEDPCKPLSDQHMAEMLAKDYNMQVARRTVAKYREMLGILPSSRRRNAV